MNTSMLIAQECLKNETEEDTTYQGLETFAATIDSGKICRRKSKHNNFLIEYFSSRSS